MADSERVPSESLGRWVEWGAGELAFLDSREARLECEVILETLLGLTRSELYLARERNPSDFPRFSEFIQARKKRVPLAYLLKRSPFWEDVLEVEVGVFTPRPETEILIESFVKEGGFSSDTPFRFLDLGTGSGAIAVTVAKLFSRAEGVASDLSGEALVVALKNAKRLGVTDRMEWIQGNGQSIFQMKSFDVIFSNPPYIPSSEWEGLEEEVRREPRLALDGGKDGLDFYHQIMNELSCLRPGGSLWLEIGWGQAERVKSLFEKKGFEQISVFKDLNGIERVVGALGFHG